MRFLRVHAGLLAVLAGCEASTAPPPAVLASELAASVRVSQSVVSLASPPDSLVAFIRVVNTRPYRVRIAPDSSPGLPDELFTGFGVRWRFELLRTADSASSGRANYFTREEIQLSPGQSIDLTHVIRPAGGVWSGWEGEYAVHASLQGRDLPIATIRFLP